MLNSSRTMTSAGISVNGISELKICSAQLICKAHEYCSEYNDGCEPCSYICNTKSHNFNALKCNTDCQDYLHDVTYVRKDDNLYLQYIRTVNETQFLIKIQLCILCFIVVVILLTFLRRSLNKKRLFSLNSTRRERTDHPPTKPEAVNSQNCAIKMPEMHLNTEEEQDEEDERNDNVNNTAMTMISSNNLGVRNPVDVNSLEYATYENRAMANTPSPVVERAKPQESCI